MNGFTVWLSQSAASYLKRMSKDTSERITAKLQELCADYSASSKQLVNRGGARSARVGNLRILFDVNEKLRRLEVSAILPRGDVYKHTKK